MTDRLLPPERVEVVQYAEDGSNAVEVSRILHASGMSYGTWGSPGGKAPDFAVHDLDRMLRPGQFLVRHPDNTVTVHDSDPSVEAEWEWGPVVGRMPDGEEIIEMPPKRRPVYRFETGTFTGNWEETK